MASYYSEFSSLVYARSYDRGEVYKEEGVSECLFGVRVVL